MKLLAVSTEKKCLGVVKGRLSFVIQFIVFIVDGKDEYMFGLTCQKHRHIVSGKLTILQNEGKMHSGKISFTPVKSVGTDCIHGDADDLVQIDLKKSN